ncbi:hypothetical protein M413DRAFT_447742 [Hebeloma cylindrosporum]|uniref:Uncharacterized protein n=1 Tax=Hebeloma cylindrosporum TaxID=76867 RepID=A0A0C2XL97_HEBCY|nr:hypothetical protein M413DRAFT_447742 [Hebeloma cylindrosporum h7]
MWVGKEAGWRWDDEAAVPALSVHCHLKVERFLYRKRASRTKNTGGTLGTNKSPEKRQGSHNRAQAHGKWTGTKKETTWKTKNLKQ